MVTPASSVSSRTKRIRLCTGDSSRTTSSTKVFMYLSGSDLSFSHTSLFSIKSFIPAASALVVVSEPPTKVSAIISA